MKEIFKKLFLNALLALIAVILVFPSSVRAADKYADDCPINLMFSATPTQVNSWSNTVTVETKVRREYPAGYFCGTDDTVNATVMYTFNGGQPTVLRNISFTLPANPTGQGETTVKTDTAQFNFSLRGGTNQKALAVGGFGSVKRMIGVRETNFTIQASQVATISLQASSNNGSSNNGTSNNGSSNNGSSNGGTIGTNNGNGASGNAGLNNNQINTGIGVNFNVNYDASLGTFFNPLDANSVPELITRIIRILFVLTGLVGVIVIIIAGFRMVIDSGNETQMKKAKQAITWAVVGLIVSILAFSIVAIVQRVIQS